MEPEVQTHVVDAAAETVVAEEIGRTDVAVSAVVRAILTVEESAAVVESTTVTVVAKTAVV